MDRRSAIKRTTALTGIGLSSVFISGVLTGCKPESIGSGYTTLIIDQNKFQFLQALSDVMIPKTETPGAVELGVPEWIDTIVAKCYPENYQKQMMAALDTVHELMNGKATADQIASVEKGDPVDASFQQVKRTIGSAYLATEYVGKELLSYLPIPGAYEACIPISETNGKAWTI
ncbi:MAG: gluconate 2-dehydrogenase subunit 3 family protein [Saprospiraceae bacterium]|nr:gluconate 2-dehydrogenase subunit 3 family protein [Saprospiraceae bacterium]